MRFLSFVVAVVMSLSACSARVVDPTDPAFDRQGFRYSDYMSFKRNRYKDFQGKGQGQAFSAMPSGYQVCMEYFPKLLTTGLSKGEVDRILKETTVLPQKNGAVQYTHIDRKMWLHTITDIVVQYDPDMRVQSVTCREGYKGL